MPTRAEAGDPRRDTLLVGRSEDLERLVRTLARGRHALLVGEKGIGKTRLLMEARRVLAGRTRRIEFAASVIAGLRGDLGVRVGSGGHRIIHVEHPAPLGGLVKEMLERLWEFGDLPPDPGLDRSDWDAVRRQVAKLGTARMQSLVYESIAKSPSPYLLFLDNLERLSPAHLPFLESLLAIAVVCGAAAQTKEDPHLRRIWSSFVRIELEPLAEADSRALVEHLFGAYPIRAADRELYLREIVAASGGSPAALKTMAWHGSRESTVSYEEIRKLRQADNARYFNMGPIYMLVFAMFTLAKIFSIGMDNTEFYIYFSALGFVAYLVVRVFRAFFLFRPQKFP